MRFESIKVGFSCLNNDERVVWEDKSLKQLQHKAVKARNYYFDYLSNNHFNINDFINQVYKGGDLTVVLCSNVQLEPLSLPKQQFRFQQKTLGLFETKLVDLSTDSISSLDSSLDDVDQLQFFKFNIPHISLVNVESEDKQGNLTIIDLKTMLFSPKCEELISLIEILGRPGNEGDIVFDGTLLSCMRKFFVGQTKSVFYFDLDTSLLSDDELQKAFSLSFDLRNIRKLVGENTDYEYQKQLNELKTNAKIMEEALDKRSLEFESTLAEINVTKKKLEEKVQQLIDSELILKSQYEQKMQHYIQSEKLLQQRKDLEITKLEVKLLESEKEMLDRSTELQILKIDLIYANNIAKKAITEQNDLSNKLQEHVKKEKESSKENKSIKSKYSLVENQFDKLKEELETTKSEYQSLASEKNTYLEEIKTLKANIDNITRDIQNRDALFRKLELENVRLQAQNEVYQQSQETVTKEFRAAAEIIRKPTFVEARPAVQAIEEKSTQNDKKEGERALQKKSNTSKPSVKPVKETSSAENPKTFKKNNSKKPKKLTKSDTESDFANDSESEGLSPVDEKNNSKIDNVESISKKNNSISTKDPESKPDDSGKPQAPLKKLKQQVNNRPVKEKIIEDENLEDEQIEIMKDTSEQPSAEQNIKKRRATSLEKENEKAGLQINQKRRKGTERAVLMNDDPKTDDSPKDPPARGKNVLSGFASFWKKKAAS